LPGRQRDTPQDAIKWLVTVHLIVLMGGWAKRAKGGVAVAEVNDVAAALLAQTGPVTTMKLQKLVYYSQAWHLVFQSEPLFSDVIEAWPQGPVTRILYEKHRGQRQVASWPAGNKDNLTEVEQHTVRWVLDKYGHFSAESLSQMTHMEAPWRIARQLLGPDERSSNPITQQQMTHFYGRQRAAVDVAVSQAAASAAMEGVELDDAWQETLRAVASGTRQASDVVAEEIRRASRQ
jgi:uncharacterized phage-associated protein